MYYALVFLVPLGIVAVVAFGESVGYGSVAFGFDTANLRRAMSGVYLDVLGRTLLFALVGTLAVLASGLPTAYWLARHAGSLKGLALVALIVPYWTSFLVRTFAFLIILSPNWGLVKAVRATGLDDGFAPLQTNLGILLGLVYNYLPLAVLPLFAALDRVDWRQLDAAADLGASKWAAFWQVTLPTARSGLVTSALLVFVPMSGEYIVPQLLGTGRTTLTATLIGQQFLSAQDYPFGAALAGVLITFVGGIALVVLAVGARRDRV